MSDDDRGAATETLDLPLRGLASEGAESRIRAALERVRGVLHVAVDTAAFRARVTYEARPGTREAVDAALHALGVGEAHQRGGTD